MATFKPAKAGIIEKIVDSDWSVCYRVPMIYSLPISIRPHIKRVEGVVERWPMRVSMDHVVKWMLQFDSDDYHIASRLIEHLDVLGSQDVRSALEVAHTKLLRKMVEKGTPLNGTNTLYAAAGDAAKSGALISYYYRIAADIPEADFISPEEEGSLEFEKIENVVLVDDVIGTGKTMAREVERVAEEIYPLSKTRNIFVLTVAGYEEGMQSILDQTGANVITALEYSQLDTVSNLDAAFYDSLSMSERGDALNRIKGYCRSISKSDLGFGKIGGLLVFDHNTPNTTLPIIWHNGRGWSPLFQRATRIAGASKIVKSAEKERQKQTAEPSPVPRRTEITLFVEGKVDELFVECLKQKRKLAEQLHVDDVSAVALGGLYQSQRLIELLKTTRKHVVFVLDDDESARRASSRMGELRDVKAVFLKPNFVAMLDLDKVYVNSSRFPGLPDRPTSTEDSRWLHLVEQATLKRMPINANAERIIQVVDEFLDVNKYNQFVSELKVKVDEVVGRLTHQT